MTRVSIQYGTLSMIGMMKNSPGPLRAWNRPRRKITTRVHWSAILMAEATTAAPTMAIVAIAALPP